MGEEVTWDGCVFFEQVGASVGRTGCTGCGMGVCGLCRQAVRFFVVQLGLGELEEAGRMMLRVPRAEQVFLVVMQTGGLDTYARGVVCMAVWYTKKIYVW